MATKRPLSWFLTERGRAVTFSTVLAAGVGLTSIKFGPHTLFLYKYKEFVQYYSNGKEVPLSKSLEDKYQKCFQILRVPESHKKLLQPFSVFGLDLFHAGSCASKFGAAIGIPKNFDYRTKDDIDKDQLQVNLKKVDWESEVGEKLADAIVLPDKVQYFAICREILATQNSKVFFDSSYPMLSIALVYSVGQTVNRKLNLYAAPAQVRGCLYLLLGTFGLGLYFFLKDYTEVLYETDVDKKLCQLGPDFIESGVVFYDKLLKRNQALRELMGKEGEDKYSKLGNENFLLRQPRIALVHRKQFFENQLKEAAKDENDSQE